MPPPAPQRLGRHQSAHRRCLDRHDVNEGPAVISGDIQVRNAARRLRTPLPAPHLIDEQLLTDIGLQMRAAVEQVITLVFDIVGQLVKQRLDDVLVVVGEPAYQRSRRRR